MNKVRHNIYIPEFLSKQLDDFMMKMGIGRSAAYTIILKTFFDQQETLLTLPELLEKVKKLEQERGKEDE